MQRRAKAPCISLPAPRQHDTARHHNSQPRNGMPPHTPGQYENSERFSFAAEPLKDNVVDCTIENITFLGSVVRIQVKVGNTKFNMDTFNNPFLELPAVGATEKVMCSKETVLVLESA